MTHSTTINIARDFSRFPGGRVPEDGESCASRFRDEILIPALFNYSSVTVEMDGTLGYACSFLEEVFCGLAARCGVGSTLLQRVLRIESSNPTIRYLVEEYLKR